MFIFALSLYNSQLIHMFMYTSGHHKYILSVPVFFFVTDLRNSEIYTEVGDLISASGVVVTLSIGVSSSSLITLGVVNPLDGV